MSISCRTSSGVNAIVPERFFMSSVLAAHKKCASIPAMTVHDDVGRQCFPHGKSRPAPGSHEGDSCYSRAGCLQVCLLAQSRRLSRPLRFRKLQYGNEAGCNDFVNNEGTLCCKVPNQYTSSIRFPKSFLSTIPGPWTATGKLTIMMH